MFGKPNFTFFSSVIVMLLFSFIRVEAQSVWDVPDDIANQKHFKRYEWYYRQRSMPVDSIPLYYHNEQLRMEEARNQSEGIQTQMSWEQLGPGAIISTFPTHWNTCSGRLRGLAVHPTDPGTVYIGAAAGGLWKTTDGGSSWQYMSTSFQSISFGAVGIDPANPDIVYAGTGEWRYNFSKGMAYGDGMYKTTDAGATWQHITSGFGLHTHFSDIVVDPFNSSIVYATLASGNWFVGNPGNEGVWRSTDQGVTWSKTLDINDAYDVACDPSASGTVYAAVGGRSGTAGFYVSTDNGQNWVKSVSGLPPANTIARMHITVSASSPSIIYALIYTGSTTVAYKTTDSGANWFQISAGVPLGSASGADQGSYDLCIAVNPANPNDVYAGNVDIHHTSNGADFSVVTLPGGNGYWDSPMHVDYHRIEYAPSNPQIMYVANDGGIWRTTDGGSTFESLNYGITTIQYYKMASHPSDTNQMFGGAQDNGVYRTLDKGATNWELVSTGDGMECFYDHTNPSNVYFSTQYGGLAKSTNGGIPWSFQGIEPDFAGNPGWLVPFFMHPTDNNIIYTAAQEVYRSTNAGGSWEIISPTLSSSSINTMHQSPVNPDNMILAASGSYSTNPPVYVSSDGGFNWTDITGNIPGDNRYIPYVLCDPIHSNTVYVMKTGYGTGKIFKSTDFGANFTDISGNLPDIPHSVLFVDPLNPNMLLTGNDFGVYASSDGGTTWVRESNGIPYVTVTDFNYIEVDGKRIIRASTYGASAFQSYLPAPQGTYLILSTPSGGEVFVEGSLVEIQWVANGISTVTIEYSTDNGSSWIGTASGVTASGNSYQWLVPGTLSDSCLVRITDDDNASNMWMSDNVFSIIELATPQLLDPEDGKVSVDTGAVLLAWSDVKGADTYYIRVAADSQFTQVLFEDTSYTDTIFTAGPLSPVQTYYWQAKSRNTGAESPFSQVFSFTTEPPRPELIYPEPQALDVPVAFTFDWTDVAGAERYRLEVSESPFHTITVVDDSMLTVSEYAISGLEHNKKYYWRVRAFAPGNNASDPTQTKNFTTIPVTGIEDEENNIPEDYVLRQNYPNPFNPSTAITFGIPEQSTVVMSVYDINGAKADVLLDESLPAGYYTVSWNGTGFASGVYIITLSAVSNESSKEYEEQMKINLLK